MAESSDQLEKHPDAEAQERASNALERGIAEIKTPEQAAQVLDSLEKASGQLSEEKVADAQPAASPGQQAAAMEVASERPTGEKPASVIVTAAVQSAQAAPEDKPIVDEAIVQAMGGAEPGHQPSTEVRRGRRLLRHELFQRLRPLQAADAFAFLEVNQLPHSKLSNLVMSRLSWVMTGGGGWLLILLLAMLHDRRRGWKSSLAVLPALWLATVTVEYPIKKWVRRRRPFYSLVQAIIVGRMPGSYSFPSGHSASSFAGALLLSREYPRGKVPFYGLAALTAFSRVYLGAHYPGDVISGSLLGAVLARIYARFLRKAGLTPGR